MSLWGLETGFAIKHFEIVLVHVSGTCKAIYVTLKSVT